MNTQKNKLIAQCGLIVVVNVILGYFIYLLPPLHHWFVFVFWAIVPAVLLIWLGSHYGGRVDLWRWNVPRGIPLGIAHLIIVINIWELIPKN